MRNNRRRRLAGIICMIGGVLLIGSTLLYDINSCRESRQELEAYKSTLSDNTERKEAAQEEAGIDTEPEGEARQEDIVCILRIPAIDSEELVKEGSSKATLANALGHIEETMLPGEAGSFVVAGHRSHTYGRLFNRLNEVKEGDLIYADMPDRTYTYEVEKIEVVEPDKLALLNSSEEASITLFTCTPIYTATHRLVITGKLVQAEDNTSVW